MYTKFWMAQEHKEGLQIGWRGSKDKSEYQLLTIRSEYILLWCHNNTITQLVFFSNNQLRLSVHWCCWINMYCMSYNYLGQEMLVRAVSTQSLLLDISNIIIIQTWRCQVMLSYLLAHLVRYHCHNRYYKTSEHGEILASFDEMIKESCLFLSARNIGLFL